MSDDQWQRVKELPADQLFELIKCVIRKARARGEYKMVLPFLCELLEVLRLTRKIEALEEGLAIINQYYPKGE